MRGYKPLPGYTGYLINDQGDIYSEKARRLMTWNMNTKSYWRVQVYCKVTGRRPHVLVHRMVALIFCKNDDPVNKIEVDHVLGMTTDPRAQYLEWVTPAENRKRKALRPWVQVVTDNGAPCPF